MFLNSLYLNQFRNYAEQSVEFSAPKTILVGENAQGKSNLLEAVELLSVLKSHRTGRDRDLVRDSTDQSTANLDPNPIAKGTSVISASISHGPGEAALPITVRMTLRASGRRTTVLNGETLRRQLDLLGTLNTVQFSSLDLDLVRGGPAYRRRWLDGLLVQLEPLYAHLLQQYGRVLRQRNALLRKADHDESELPSIDLSSSLAMWDAQLATLGTRLMRRRARALDRLTPLAQHWHEQISGSREALNICYQPSVAREQPEQWDQPEALQGAFLEKIQQRAIAEQVNGTSLVGPHRDEVDFRIDGTPARQYGSQGQQRTLVLALKLAELKLIDDVIGQPPLLLLDDVLAELDLNRQNQLLEAIQTRFQTLITTTHLSVFDAQWLKSSQVLTVKSGQIVDL